MRWINFWVRTPQIVWSQDGRPVLLHHHGDETYEELTQSEFEEAVDFLIEFGMRASTPYYGATATKAPRIYKVESAL
jgi:hypothetical protein